MSCRCSVRKFLEAYAARANRAKILQKLSLHEATNQTGSSIKVFFALANREYLFLTLFLFLSDSILFLSIATHCTY